MTRVSTCTRHEEVPGRTVAAGTSSLTPGDEQSTTTAKKTEDNLSICKQREKTRQASVKGTALLSDLWFAALCSCRNRRAPRCSAR